MKWNKSKNILVGADAFIDLLKILSAILILYGVVLDKKYDLIGKIGVVILGLISYAVSQYLKYKRNDIINSITHPMIIPIVFGTTVPYESKPNNLLGVVKIKALFIKNNILTTRFSVNDDKPFHLSLEVNDLEQKIEFQDPKTLDAIPITPRMINDNFDMQRINLDDLKLSEEELKKKRRIFVRVTYQSEFVVDDDIRNNEAVMSNIKSGKIKLPIIPKHDQKIFEGSFAKNNFKIV